MEMFKQEREEAMVYKHEEVKQMISIKSGTVDVTILSDHISGNPLPPIAPFFNNP